MLELASKISATVDIIVSSRGLVMVLRSSELLKNHLSIQKYAINLPELTIRQLPSQPPNYYGWHLQDLFLPIIGIYP